MLWVEWILVAFAVLAATTCLGSLTMLAWITARHLGWVDVWRQRQGGDGLYRYHRPDVSL